MGYVLDYQWSSGGTTQALQRAGYKQASAGHDTPNLSQVCLCLCVPAATHSGMTLAPLVGQLVAEEVLAAGGHSSSSSGSSATEAAQEAAELLAPYRPDRDFEAAAAAAKQQPGLSWAATLNPSRR